MKKESAPQAFLQSPGTFLTGANYWASHAGTNMWRNWDEKVVEKDFKLLSANGIQALRVFPLWPDFQPITMLKGGGNHPREIRFGEEPLPDTEAGRAGVNEVMIQRFRKMADLAEKYKLALVVGIVTGWMSGRYYTPPALEDKHVYTDPLSLRWQSRFVKYFVKSLKDAPAIKAWDLGNECNCMGGVESSSVAYSWTAFITNAIRSEDTSRPVVSGMHSLTAEERNGKWTIQDQAELTEILTTHPYPQFTPYARFDPCDTIRSVFHAVSETRFYGEVGNRSAFIEEIGTLGPMIAGYEKTRSYTKNVLWNAWAHDCRGFFWWCAFDQEHLAHAPYDWNSCERELGMFSKDYEPAASAVEMKKFRNFVDKMPFGKLPELKKDAVCILGTEQDQWAVAYSSFILSKQAGFNIEFQYGEQPLKDSDFYIMPSVKGQGGMSGKRWKELVEKVRKGASLYVSMDLSFFSKFKDFFGVEVQTRSSGVGSYNYELKLGKEKLELSFPVKTIYDMKSVGADVLGTDKKTGKPVFFETKFGKGTIYLLTFPVETLMIERGGTFQAEESRDAWKLYKYIAADLLKKKVISKENAYLAVTEHDISASEKVCICVNCSPADMNEKLTLKKGWTLSKLISDDASAACKNGMIDLKLKENSGAVLILKK